jgi:hypothetical protein
MGPLMIEAFDRYHVDMDAMSLSLAHSPAGKPHSSQTGEWTAHAAEVHHQEWRRLLEILPSSSVGADLRERSQVLDRDIKMEQERFQRDKRCAVYIQLDRTARYTAWLDGATGQRYRMGD